MAAATKSLIIGSGNPAHDAFIKGAAGAFFVTAYADYVEEGSSTDNELTEDERKARRALPRPGGGEDWCDYAPTIPPAAYALAGQLWAELETSNPDAAAGVFSLIEWALRADQREGKRGRDVAYADDEIESFGHYMAMQSMGHGVGWFDDHAEFPMTMPHIECSQFSFDERCYLPDDGA